MRLSFDAAAQFVREVPLSVLRALYGIRIRTRVLGRPFYVDARDNIISFELLFRHVWERSETAFLQSILRPGDRVIDIGAHVGYYAVLFGAAVGPMGKVLALEPDPDNAAMLRQNIDLNGLGSTVTAIQAAAGSHFGQSTLFRVDSRNGGDHRMYAATTGQVETPVEVVTIDEMTATWNRVDIIKMDVQGNEPYVLAGMQSVLARNSDVILVTEFWPHGLSLAGTDASRFIDELTASGFSLFELGPHGKLTQRLGPELIARYRNEWQFSNLVCARPPAIQKRLVSP